jgi:hypothetical protein
MTKTKMPKQNDFDGRTSVAEKVNSYLKREEAVE